MPKIQQVAGKVQLEVERFDGGRNTKDAPSELSIYESPDELNVTYDDQGSVSTRDGSETLNTTAIGTCAIDGLASYNNSMVAWANGSMYYMSGTTFSVVPSAQCAFVSGTKVAHTIYQNVLFCSDGTSAYKYTDPTMFYQHGIAVGPNSTVASASTGTGPNSGTYYYRIAYENSQVVEGEAGAATSITNNGYVTWLRGLPVGATSQGVENRLVYRASTSAGPYKYVGTVTGNVATTFMDVMTATTFNAQTRYAVDDGTAPTPYTAIKLHKERLFITDTDRSVIRWTNFANPYISEAENYQALGEGDESDIKAIAVQDDLITAFKENSIFIGALNDPSDDTSWNWIKSPANLGIVGPNAFWEGPGYIVFLARSAANTSLGRIFGFCILQGLDVQDASHGPLRTKSISEKIEPDVLAFPYGYWDNTAMIGFNNAVHIACSIASTTNDKIYWFDINRLVGEQGQPGSWALWDGIPVACWCVHNGYLYGGSSNADGFVRKLYAGSYDDSGTAINSYYYTKPLGGEQSIDSWIKDFRALNLWYQQVGTGVWSIYAKTEQIYDGTTQAIGGDENLVANVVGVDAGGVYGTGLYGTATYYVEPDAIEGWWTLGATLARRVSFKFTNGNAVGQAFKVLGLKASMNLRRQK